jgi:hypothetical protein
MERHVLNADETEYPSLTPSVVQVRWKVPTRFPACPDRASENWIEQYSARLKFAEVFAVNDYSTSLVVQVGLSKSGLVIITRFEGDPIKDWAVASVFLKNDRFYHRSESTFFSLQGALKSFCELTGQSYEESFDDYA